MAKDGEPAKLVTVRIDGEAGRRGQLVFDTDGSAGVRDVEGADCAEVSERLVFATALAVEEADPPPPAVAERKESLDGRPTPTSEARHDVTLGLVGGVATDSYATLPLLGVDVFYRRGLLLMGVIGNVGLSLGDLYTYWGGGPAFGISVPSPPWLRVDLLGVAGLHSYSHVPLQANDGRSHTDVGATLPFAGARARIGTVLGPFVIGVEGLLETDIGTTTKTYDVVLWGQPSTTTQSRAVAIGGSKRYAAGIYFGTSFDL